MRNCTLLISQGAPSAAGFSPGSCTRKWDEWQAWASRLSRVVPNNFMVASEGTGEKCELSSLYW